MYHLHDGPPSFLFGIERQPEKVRPRASLSAFTWAAERAGTSYGAFIIGLTDVDQKQIQQEYEAYQREYRKTMRDQMKARRERKTFIIDDQDL